MHSNICTYFLKDHCKFKNVCRKSHDILTCKFGRSCTFPCCPFRHPPDCTNFLQNKCGFPNKDNIFVPYSFCNHYHPPILPTYHPPSGLPPHPHLVVPPFPSSWCPYPTRYPPSPSSHHQRAKHPQDQCPETCNRSGCHGYRVSCSKET